MSVPVEGTGAPRPTDIAGHGTGDTSVPRLGYLPRLDGMRAVAILLVMAFHSWPRLKGGQLGVDVFFALSGFLITTLVLEEMRSHEGKLNFRYFYARRSLRLFPALYSMLAVFAVYVLVRWSHLDDLMAPAGGKRSDLWKFFAGAGTYTTNLVGLTARPGNLFGHTWSLAVEEQFYLVWPTVLLVSLRSRRVQLLAGFTVAFAVACLLARVGAVHQLDGVLANRLDAIGLGSGAAIARLLFPRLRALVVRWAPLLAPASLAALGVVVLAVSFGVSDAEKALERGGYSVVALISAVLVWSVAECDRGPVVWLFAQRPMVQVGLLSYGLYIWHQPIFRVLAWEFRAENQGVVLIAKWAISIAAAVASYWIVEKPARRLQQRFRVGATAASR